MDPRHPELAVARIKELIKQYDRIEADISKVAASSQLGQLEREGGLVIQEICLVAPRIHEAMMQASRKRRYELTHTPVLPEVPAELLKEPTPEAVENYIEQAKEDYENRPKKKTSKKKSSKKKVED